MSLSIWTRLKTDLINNRIDLNNLTDFEREIDRNRIDWIDNRYIVDATAAVYIVDYRKHYFENNEINRKVDKKIENFDLSDSSYY